MRDFVIKRRISCSDEKLFRIAPHLMAFMLELVPSAFKFVIKFISVAFVFCLQLVLLEHLLQLVSFELFLMIALPTMGRNCTKS